jgi:hypothetical protein
MYQNTLFVLDATDNDLCNYAWKTALDDPDTAVRLVRGNKMRVLDGLFDEISVACQFSYYFCDNWPSFTECLGDLDWKGSLRFVLIISKFDEVLVDEPLEMKAFGRSLGLAVNEYNRGKNNQENNDSMFRVAVSGKDIDQKISELLIGEIGGQTVLHI